MAGEGNDSGVITDDVQPLSENQFLLRFPMISMDCQVPEAILEMGALLGVTPAPRRMTAQSLEC